MYDLAIHVCIMVSIPNMYLVSYFSLGKQADWKHCLFFKNVRLFPNSLHHRPDTTNLTEEGVTGVPVTPSSGRLQLRHADFYSRDQANSDEGTDPSQDEPKRSPIGD